MTLTAKDKKQIMILAGLIFIFAFASKDSFSRIKKSKERLKKTRLVQTFAATGLVSQGTTGTGVAEEAAGPGVGIDPFSGRPISIGAEEAVYSFRLSGIVFNPQDKANSFAIINNRPYKVGEVISNSEMKIVDIGSEEVILSNGKITKTLKTW